MTQVQMNQLVTIRLIGQLTRAGGMLTSYASRMVTTSPLPFLDGTNFTISVSVCVVSIFKFAAFVCLSACPRVCMSACPRLSCVSSASLLRLFCVSASLRLCGTKHTRHALTLTCYVFVIFCSHCTHFVTCVVFVVPGWIVLLVLCILRALSILQTRSQDVLRELR